MLFWTWGRSFPAAEADLKGTAKPVRNGYSELRAKLHRAGFHFVIVTWRWELQFAMWVSVPGADLAGLSHEIDCHCGLLTEHLVRNGSGQQLIRPQVEVD